VDIPKSVIKIGECAFWAAFILLDAMEWQRGCQEIMKLDYFIIKYKSFIKNDADNLHNVKVW
jgi:hypothetical protein